MPDPIRIDARGMKCPRPIIELAKARRQAPPGATIVITADDLAFESDVRAWCDTTGNTLDSLIQDGNALVASIRLAGEQGGS
jgi:tRNA 2-thiouridine synthesizing protein A